jgi:hypothetical protein
MLSLSCPWIGQVWALRGWLIRKGPGWEGGFGNKEI